MTDAEVVTTLAWQEEHAAPIVRADTGHRYGLHTELAFGMPMVQGRRAAAGQ